MLKFERSEMNKAGQIGEDEVEIGYTAADRHLGRECDLA